MKMQEALDRAYLGVVRQGCKSASVDRGRCYYRCISNDKELRCAVGWLLDDEQLKQIGSSNPPARQLVEHLVGRIVDDVPRDDEARFLVQLQAAHDLINSTSDDEVFVEMFRANMAKLAKRWNLTLPPDPTS